MYHVECVINRLNACEKSFKILKCSPEAVNQRWTENTMLNVKKRNRTNNAVQNTTQKILKIEQLLIPMMNTGAPEG
jgi:hypothetical protein